MILNVYGYGCADSGCPIEKIACYSFGMDI